MRIGGFQYYDVIFVSPIWGRGFAPQARPKMSDFEQKRQFFDVFSPISAKFHPYEGGFLVKIENDVILKNFPSIWGECIRAQQFKLFGVTHMGGDVLEFRKNIPLHMGGMFWNFEKFPLHMGGMFSRKSLPPMGKILGGGFFLCPPWGKSQGGGNFQKSAPPIWGGNNIYALSIGG